MCRALAGAPTVAGWRCWRRRPCDRPFIDGPEEPGKAAPRAAHHPPGLARRRGGPPRSAHPPVSRAAQARTEAAPADPRRLRCPPSRLGTRFALHRLRHRHPQRARPRPAASVWVVDTAGGEPREAAALRGDADFPAWSPDGSRLAFLGRDEADAPEYAPLQPWLLPADRRPGAAGRARDRRADRDLGVERAGPAHRRTRPPVAGWRHARLPGRTAWALRAGRGSTRRWASANDGRCRIGCLASGMDVAAGKLVISATVDGRAAELYAVEDGRLRRLTRDGSTWQRRYHGPPA